MITTSTIYRNTKNINEHNGLLDTAMECAAFLEQIGAFAFKNWINGEVVEGPIVEKYYVTIKLMFPDSMPPDPAVIERLGNMDCMVELTKDKYKRVAIIKTDDPSAIAQDGFQKRLFEHQIWVVTVKIPQRYLALDGNTVFDIDGEKIEFEDIEAVYKGVETDAIDSESSGSDDPFGEDTDDDLSF